MEEIVNLKLYNYTLDVIKHLLFNTPLNPLENNEDYIYLYQIAKYHDLTAIVYDGIKEYLPEEIKINWERKVNQKIFKSISQLEEKNVINDLMTKHEIKHCFLKGCYLKTIYPEHYYREMSDIDVLIPTNSLHEVHSLLINELGYENNSNFGSHHQTYIKKPVYNIEVHYELVDDDVPQFNYFKNLSNKVLDTDELDIKMDINEYFIFFLYHAYHHFEVGGIGLRYIIDLYFFMKENKDKLDSNLINKTLKELNIDSFYNDSINYMENIFFDKKNKVDQDFIYNIFSSGTYGTTKNRVNYEMKKKKRNKIGYLFARLFPNPKRLKTMYPILKKHPILYPFIYISRPFKAIKTWKVTKGEIKDLSKYKED